MMVELAPTLRRFGELDTSDELAALVVVMSPTTMDRRTPAPAAMAPEGPLEHQAGVVAEEPDPDPNVGAVG